MNNKTSWSRYRCVFHIRNHFLVVIQAKNKTVYKATFDDEIAAAVAYDNFIKENNFDRRLNFPDNEPESLIPDTKLIRLTKGKYATVDADEYDRMIQYNWCALKGNNTWYAVRYLGMRNGRKAYIRMHNDILDSKELHVDHIDGNGLMNIKTNLRKCTQQQNNMNSRSRGGTSIYKGVTSYANKKYMWRSLININGKSIFIGSYENEEEAARAYDSKAKELFGEFAWLNFPN